MHKILIEDFQLKQKVKEKLDQIAFFIKNDNSLSPNLMDGKTGEVIFWAYYGEVFKGNSQNIKVDKLLSEVFDIVNSGFKYPTFAGGLAGIGWAVEHLVQNGFLISNTDKVIGILDDYLYPYMVSFIDNGNYDYLHGALGIGLYYLSRVERPKSQKYLKELVYKLENHSTRMKQGIAWESKLMPDNDVIGYNLSMSHGISSVITILSRIYESGICKDKVSKLTVGAVNFLLHSGKMCSNKLKYPSWICKNDINKIANYRLAWCYNDLGIAIALFQAGKIFNNSMWKEEGINTLLNTTRINTLEEGGVRDAGLCHGTSGIAHIYHKMYKNTNIVAFKDASQVWFERTIELISTNLKKEEAQSQGSLSNYFLPGKSNFLTGYAGIGLSLLSAISKIESKWDRILLLS